MIKPEDLMALAKRLTNLPGEPEGRAAVGRAYYAAFHIARVLIEDGCGVVLPDGPEIHRKWMFCLSESKNDDLMNIADKLSSLRAERNRADYLLQDSRFANRSNVHLQLAEAETIIRRLTATRSQLPEFRPVIRTYAQSTLKLRLKGA
jgi:hypothetical protein